uniref:Aminotransferase-like plant mobile domain-containing protein n=1 Tax=Fagus sylvatica TaxID=28930 RepID=A0A2N9G8W3_FAGSY
MWSSKDHRSAGLWWSFLSSGGCLADTDFGRPWEISWSFQPLPHLFRHLLRHLPQLAPPQIVFVTEFACEPLGNLLGPLGNPWTTGWRGGPALLQFSGLWLMLPWTVFSGTMCLEHRVKRGGKNGAYETAIFPLFFEFISGSSCAADLSLKSEWAGLEFEEILGIAAPTTSRLSIYCSFNIYWVLDKIGRKTKESIPPFSLFFPIIEKFLVFSRWLCTVLMASSSTAPVGPSLQPSTGEGLEAPPTVPAASTEAMVDAPVVSPPVPGESVPAPPSSVSGEAEDLRGDLQATPINFDFLCAASKDWSHWVDREILDPDFWDRLVDAGIHWSILISRSCNMFRDTESLRELLRRWCPSTHTFFFSWGELTPTLEDVANHWMLPILGEYSLSNIKLSAAEEETAAALRKRSSTRLSGLALILCPPEGCFSPPCRLCVVLAMISAGHCFPLAPLFLGHLYSQLDLLHDCEIQGDSCYILSAAFNTSALQTFFWEHSVSYTFAARDKSAAWSRFSDLPREFLEHFPDFRDNLPLVYRWVGLKTHDHDLVDALDYEENVLFRPYGDDHPGFTCASIFKKFYRSSPLIRDLKVDDYRSLSYLSTVNPGLPTNLVCHGCFFHPLLSTAAFLKSRAFVRWGGETTRVLIPGGHRLGYNTPTMGAYWQRFTQSMVDFVIAGRSDKTPMRLDCVYHYICRKGWRNSVNVVEDRLIMLSKRGKGSKRDAPADLAIEKTPKKPTPSVPSSKKAPSEKAKAVKKDKPPLLVPSAAKESTEALVQGSTKSAIAPPKRKTRAGKESKSTPSVPSAAEESTTVPLEEPTESTEGPSKKTKAGKKSKSPASVPPVVKESTMAPVEEPAESTVAPSKPKSVEPSAVSTPSPPKKKKFTAPLFPLGATGRTRSKNGPKVTHGSGRSSGSVVDVEDSDVADDDIIASPVRKDAPQTAAVDQDEDLGKSTANSSETGDESMGEERSSSSDSFFDSTAGSVPEDQIVSGGSTADDDDMAKADDSSMGGAGSMEEDLAIVAHAGHVHDDDSTVDADVDPISFSLPQTVLTSAGSDISIAHVMEGISLFGVTPSLRAIPAGGFVIPVSHLTSEASPVVGGALMPEETHAQGLIESESVVDLGVDAAGHDAPIEDAGVSAVDALAGSDHLENIGVDDTVHVLEDVGEIGTTGEVTAVSPPPRPTIEAGSSVGVGGLSSEVADFLKEFDAKAPNPHPEQYFWSFNGPLVPFGDFWVPNDCSPYLSRLSAGHGDFTKGFKLSIGLGGPMLSLLGSVLAAMSESSLEDVTTTRILAWRSVIQDLMDVGFDLGFMIERLRQTAQCLFGKRLADEIKALQHQIALLQDSLAELTAYQNEMMSTGRMVPRSGRGGSFLDSLLD